MVVWIKIKAFIKKYWWAFLAAPVFIIFVIFISNDRGAIYRVYTRLRDKMKDADNERDKELEKLRKEKERKEKDLEDKHEVSMSLIKEKYKKELQELKEKDEKRYKELCEDPSLLLDALNKHLGNS